MRGEFRRADGLVIPNNIMTYGIKAIYNAALKGAGYNMFLGLAKCNPDPLLDLNALNEPTLGVNGYERQSIPQGSGWPTQGLFNGEQYFETQNFTFAATGAAFDKPTTRLVIVNHETAVTGQLVIALSSPLPAEITIDPLMAIELRTFSYRIYGR